MIDTNRCYCSCHYILANHTYQCLCNCRYISKNDDVSKLALKVETQETYINKMQKKIDELESHIKERLDVTIVHQLLDEVTKLRPKISGLQSEINIVRALAGRPYIHKSEKPYKCPVCEGSSKDKNRLVAEPYDQEIKIFINPPCNACQGKGIVWR